MNFVNGGYWYATGGYRYGTWESFEYRNGKRGSIIQLNYSQQYPNSHNSVDKMVKSVI